MVVWFTPRTSDQLLYFLLVVIVCAHVWIRYSLAVLLTMAIWHLDDGKLCCLGSRSCPWPWRSLWWIQLSSQVKTNWARLNNCLENIFLYPYIAIPSWSKISLYTVFPETSCPLSWANRFCFHFCLLANLVSSVLFFFFFFQNWHMQLFNFPT